MMLRKSLCFSMLLFASLAFADDTSDVRALKKDMPQDVVAMIGRIVECNRWNGEEPSTKARAEEVNQALTRLGCATLEQDEAKIIKFYQNNYEVKSRIGKAKEIF